MSTLITLLSVFLFYSCATNNNPLVGNWVEVMPVNTQIIQGVTLNSDRSASSIGMATLKYERWQSFDSKLVLWGQSIGNGQTINFSDTLFIVRLTADSLVLGNGGMYQISYTKEANIDSIKKFNILDSLKVDPQLGKLLHREFENDSLALSLYNQEYSGDGVYSLTDKINGNICYGRQYTLRGDAVNINAVVYQLVSFNHLNKVNLLYNGGNLELLNEKFEKEKSPLLILK